MLTPRLCLVTALTALPAAGCGTDGGTATSDSTATGTSASASTSASTGAGPTTDLPATTGAPTTGSGSTTQGGSASTSGDETTSSTGGSTGAGSAQTSTSDGSTGTGGTGSESTGGGVPVTSFDCTELTVVDLQLKEKISGSFDAQGVPLDVTATMVKGGAIDFHVAAAGPVADDDPYAADVAFWEQELTAQGWDVNPPGEPGGDRRYIFIPEGAQFVAKFSLFYYRVYEGDGNGQFEFECLKQ